MSDFFSRLAERALGLAPILQPRVTPLFAQAVQPMGEPLLEESLETDITASSNATDAKKDSQQSIQHQTAPLMPSHPQSLPHLSDATAIETDHTQSSHPQKTMPSLANSAIAGITSSTQKADESALPAIEVTQESALPTIEVTQETKQQIQNAGLTLPLPVPSPTSTTTRIAAPLSPTSTTTPRIAPPLSTQVNTSTSQASSSTLLTPVEALLQSTHLHTETHHSTTNLLKGQSAHGNVISTTQMHAPREQLPLLAQRVTPAIKPEVSSIISRVTEIQHTTQPSAETQPTLQTAPTIQVTIGRIEVRAIPASTAVAPISRQHNEPVVQSLDDYLRQRAKGGHA